MQKEFKYTIWYMGGKLFLIYIFSIIINLFILGGLLNLFNDSVAWNWVVSVLAVMVNLTLVYMFISIDGRKDIQIDGANKKRKERYPDFNYVKKFNNNKGFLAGLIAQSPIIVLYIIWFIMKSGSTDSIMIEFILRASFSHYFQMMSLWGLNIFAVLFYLSLYILTAGLAYMSAKAYRKKVLTIIKRNEEKATMKGLKR